MAEYVVMPKTDYVDACDAAREKAGYTGEIKSGELGEIFRSVTPQENLSPELQTQDALIASIMTALEGKAGGSTGGSLETCFVTISEWDDWSLKLFYTGPAGAGEVVVQGTEVTLEVVKNSPIVFYYDATLSIADCSSTFVQLTDNNGSSADGGAVAGAFMFTGDGYLTVAY